jgi:hypothetical protein
MDMNNSFDYCVKISLRTTIFDLQGRMHEIDEMREWVNVLVNWEYSQYLYNVITVTNEVYFWFKQEKHAMMCALRWA